MELQKWKVFKYVESNFAADVKRAYSVAISSSQHHEIENDDESKVLPWSCGGVMVMKNGDVYFTTLTTNIGRQVRLKMMDESVPYVPVKIDGICGQEIRDVQSGTWHVVVVMMDARVFQWGEICAGDDRDYRAIEPHFVTGNGFENKRIIQVACGNSHTLALTSEGQVYSWGNNSDGQLGTGIVEGHEVKPAKISGKNEFDSRISYIACGEWTSFALDEGGNVWSWGSSRYDALGYDTDGYQLIPWKIPDLPKITMIAVGDNHTLALSNKKELYFWGQQASEESVMTPKKMKVPNVALIGAIRGCSISAFKTTEGEVYYWGFACGHYISEPVATKYSTMVKLFASLDSPVMLGPLKFDVKQPMMEKLKLIFDDSDTSDIKFEVEEKPIHAHKLLLKLRSDYFKRMLDNSWKESEQNEVKITEFTYQGFRTFLFYLYTDRVEPAPQVADEVIELLKLADYYGEEDLKRRCEQQLRFLITEDNFSQIYSASFQYNSKVLHEIALDLAVPNLNEIVQTEGYKSMSDELQKRLIQELAEEGVLYGLERKRAKYRV